MVFDEKMATWKQLTLGDFFACAPALWNTVINDPLKRPAVDRAMTTFRALREQGKSEFVEHLSARLFDILSRHSRIDKHFFWFHWNQDRTANGAVRIEIELHASAPEKAIIEIDGERRPAYRCAGIGPKGNLNWLSWNSRTIGWDGDKEYPVFVQSHAIDRVYERLPFKNAAHIVHNKIYESLCQPLLVRQSADEYLAEYRLVGQRVGYLVAKCLEDRIVVRTFLFLTMQGTPEAKRLSEKMRLNRPDVEHMRLDRLETFVNTDLRNDRELVNLFDECGCGHLFGIVARMSDPLALEGYSRKVREYLGFPSLVG